MISLSLRFRPIGLPKDCCDFLRVQITHNGPVHFLYWDACNLAALRDHQRFATGDKGEEAVDGGQATVAGADGYLPFTSGDTQNRPMRDV
jgi:hypothetical protein